LSVLSKNSCYASDIIKELKEARVIVVEGTLYPLLTRQKNAGLLSYRWEESQQGPPRKYYELTSDGKEYLADLDNSWDELVESVNLIRTR
jgi:PadR family transcriptional regulator PadR